MGFYRAGQPMALNRSEVRAHVENLLGDLLLAENAPLTRADPFLVDDVCEFNGGGPHVFTGSCGDVVCLCCGKIVWD